MNTLLSHNTHFPFRYLRILEARVIKAVINKYAMDNILSLFAHFGNYKP